MSGSCGNAGGNNFNSQMLSAPSNTEPSNVEGIDNVEGSADQQKMLEMINAYRAENGLGPVELSDELSQSMTEHAQSMENGIFHSDDLGGGTMENVAQGQDAEQVFEMWKDSPGHRANMLKEDITEIGLGVDGDKWALNGR